MAASITLECPECCLSTAGRTHQWSALAAFSVASALSLLRHAVDTHRVRCRATRGFEGFMSVCRPPRRRRRCPRAWQGPDVGGACLGMSIDSSETRRCCALADPLRAGLAPARMGHAAPRTLRSRTQRACFGELTLILWGVDPIWTVVCHWGAGVVVFL